ncbi:uncharacterized protein LOC144113107 isoform X2 [Amblyomma americanum]
MTDVMSLQSLFVPGASRSSTIKLNCDADSTTDSSGRLMLPEIVAGTPAIAMLPQRKGSFLRGTFYGKNGGEWADEETGEETSDFIRTLQKQLKEMTISGAVYRLMQNHEAHGFLNAERRFPCANTLTGVYSIYRGASFDVIQSHCLSSVPPFNDRKPNLGRLEGWLVVTLPWDHAGLSFGAEIQKWCGEPELLKAPQRCFTSSHRHQCVVKKDVTTLRSLPRFLVRQSDDMLMLVLHASAADPTTVSGSFCACKAAFRMFFTDCRSPEEVYSVAVATPFAKDSLLDAYKVVSLQKILFIFLYKTKSAVGSWMTISVGTGFDRLQALVLEPPMACITERTQFSKFSSVESVERNKKEAEGASHKSKAPLIARQQRSLSESCAYQIPERTRRGILKNGIDWRRTISESSDDCFSATSLDSDLSCPASSLESIQPKKTVSFSDHVSHIVYRANSSVLARRRRNQKKAANKKKAAARRALNRFDSTDTSGISSGSEASLEDISRSCQPCPPE